MMFRSACEHCIGARSLVRSSEAPAVLCVWHRPSATSPAGLLKCIHCILLSLVSIYPEWRFQTELVHTCSHITDRTQTADTTAPCALAV